MRWKQEIKKKIDFIYFHAIHFVVALDINWTRKVNWLTKKKYYSCNWFHWSMPFRSTLIVQRTRLISWKMFNFFLLASFCVDCFCKDVDNWREIYWISHSQVIDCVILYSMYAQLLTKPQSNTHFISNYILKPLQLASI